MVRSAALAALILGLFNSLGGAQQATVASTGPDVTEKARVFVTDSESWEVNGAGAGSNGSFAAQSHGGARPQTAEIVKTFGQRCPNVIVNNRQEFADYIVVLDHEGGKGYLRHRNKVAVFERISGDVVVSHSTLSLGGSVEDACNGITQHWAAHSREILAAKQKPSSVPGPAPALAPASAQQSPTFSQASISVESTPPGADIEVDGGFVGNTPSTVSLAPGSHQILVRKKGYADWNKTLSVTGGTIHLNAELDHAAAQ
jgi:hypothetical protein